MGFSDILLWLMESYGYDSTWHKLMFWTYKGSDCCLLSSCFSKGCHLMSLPTFKSQTSIHEVNDIFLGETTQEIFLLATWTHQSVIKYFLFEVI